jgi:hypothetical protein
VEHNLTDEEVNEVLRAQQLTLDQLITVLEAHLRMGDIGVKQEDTMFWLIKLEYHRIYKKHCS